MTSVARGGGHCKESAPSAQSPEIANCRSLVPEWGVEDVALGPGPPSGPSDLKRRRWRAVSTGSVGSSARYLANLGLPVTPSSTVNLANVASLPRRHSVEPR